MKTDLNFCYEFGGFVLYPHEHLLLHLNQSIALPGKDFDVLEFLVKHAGSANTASEIAISVWGPEGTRQAKNISHYIARIRKAIGCSVQHPRFIKTVHGKDAYRFIAPVKVSEVDSSKKQAFLSAQVDPNAAQGISVNSHLFVPTYFGNAYGRIHGEEHANKWIKYKELKIESGRLCILPTGFGVWHLRSGRQLEHLFELASWRKETYDQILNGKHVIKTLTRDLIGESETNRLLRRFEGLLGYVFSVFELARPGTKNTSTVRNMLQLLCIPSALETIARSKENESLLRRERQLIEQGIRGDDISEFGTPAVELGYASWDAVSYFSEVQRSPGLIGELVDLEIAVQSLWWTSKCLNKLMLIDGVQGNGAASRLIPEIKRQLARLNSISATESPSQRTMTEVVIRTSRLASLVSDTIKLYEESKD